MLMERGRLAIEGDFRKWVNLAQSRFPVKQAPLNFEVALKSREISLPHKDPADHFLAATALVYELTLMTVDQHLVEAEWLPTLS
jgi:PIN domain nuclease of toxin-antitoxin system